MKYRFRQPNPTNAVENTLVYPYFYLWGVIVNFFKGVPMDSETWFFGLLTATIIMIDVITSLVVVTGTWELLLFVTFWRIVLYAIALDFLLGPEFEFLEGSELDF